MVRVYTAGPYRAKSLWGILKNIYRAWRVAKRLWKEGFAVLCPHANTLLMSEGKILPKQFAVPVENFLKGDLELLRMCDVVLMLPGWQDSEGSIGEKEDALANHIPVVYSVNELIDRKREFLMRRI